MAWVWLVLLYGALKGVRDVAKKKAVQISGALDVLLLYTLLSFLLVLPDAKNASLLRTRDSTPRGIFPH